MFHIRRSTRLLALPLLFAAMPLLAAEPVSALTDAEILEQFQALIRIDTSNPPGNETVLVEHLAALLQAEGIEVQKKVGRIAELARPVGKPKRPAYQGISHTR